MKKITLKDIAREVGTSVVTVSRVINKNDMKAASPETVKHILEIVDKTGYSSKTINSSVQGAEAVQMRNSVGIILCSSKEDKFTHSFYAEIYNGIHEALTRENFTIDFYYTLPEVDYSISANENVFSPNNENLILIDEFGVIYEPNIRLLNKIKAKFKNTVSLCINNGAVPNDMVYVDGYEAACSAVQRLIDSGRRRILLMGGNNAEYILKPEEADSYIDARFNAYKNTLLKNGLKLEEQLVCNASWDSQTAYNILDTTIKRNIKIDAIFAADDMMAIACLKALHDNRVRVPEDVAIIGFNDLEVSSYSHPSLTTVHIPRREMGRAAAEVIMLRSNGKLGLPLKASLPVSVVIRQSCGTGSK